MNVLKLVLGFTKYQKVCFLCFKDEVKTTNIFYEMEVIGDCFNFTLSLAKMFKKIIPSHEILFEQACEDCTNLIIKMFLTLHKYNRNLMTLNCMLNNLDEQLKDIDFTDKERLFITLNAPELNDTAKENCSTVNKTFGCEKCEMKFNALNFLMEHKKSVHNITNEATICDICGQTFRKAKSLKAHFNCHKEKQCPYCFKTLKTHSHFNVHVKGHKSDVKRKRNKLNYNCDTCSYVTVNKRTLEAHINKMHLKIRPYTCETCFKGFHKKSNLTEHLKTHLQIKNKTCEICGDHFVSEKTLNEHQRLHSNVKPYECKICGKKFVTSGRRSDHTKRSHMEKTECCLFCDKKFSLRNELKRHVKKNHNESMSVVNDNDEVHFPSYKFDDSLMLPIT